MKPRICPICGEASDDGKSCSKCSDQMTIAPSSKNDDATLAPSTPQGNASTKPENASPEKNILPKDFGDYVLLEELARGGMGVVYKARDKELNRIVAIKMIISGQYSSDQDVQRFQLEAKAAAQLDHPGIVPIYEIGVYDDQPFFAMKLVEGGSLSENRKRFLKEPRIASELIAKASRAVHHAHQRGVLHRDIKPANILLGESNQPMLTDLGLAKLSSTESNLTQTGVVLGTPSYMPPEQAKSSGTLTTAADIYSLGAVLYELLVGHPPHRGDSALETVLQVINEPVIPVRDSNSDVDGDLELICMKCLHKDPAERYETAIDLASDLESWLAGSSISIKPASIVKRTTQWIKHNQGIVYVIMLLLAGMLMTMPLVFSILGVLVLDGVADSYAGTEADPKPMIYSFTAISPTVSIVCGLITLFLWPSLGLLVSVLTRPANWSRAAINGSWVAGITTLLMALLMGWAVFAIASQSVANRPIRILAENVWPPHEDTEPEAAEAKLNQLYPKLTETPYNQKVNFLANRIFMDGVAIGPGVALALLILMAVLALPIVFGAVVAQQLILRGHRWWILVPRYLLGWFAILMSVGMIAVAISNGTVNDTKFWDMQLWQQILWVVSPLIGTFLILRKWKTPRTSTS